MPKAERIERTKPKALPWQDCRIGITGANGALGRELTRKLQAKGAFVIGLTHKKPPESNLEISKGPNKWIEWSCGKEDELNIALEGLDVLILNHGINPKGVQTTKALNEAIEVNALSTWKIMNNFESISYKHLDSLRPRELWINTSEAEIQPALSPGYEISKRLIGQLVSIRWNNLTKEERELLKIRKLILGPFKSDLNPLGIMSAELVASQIIRQAELKFNLIIVTPNPITYFLMPVTEFFRGIYSRIMRPNEKA